MWHRRRNSDPRLVLDNMANQARGSERVGGVGVGGFRVRGVRGALSALRFGALGINTGLFTGISAIGSGCIRVAGSGVCTWAAKQTLKSDSL